MDGKRKRKRAKEKECVKVICFYEGSKLLLIHRKCL